ncbi:regulatory protein RecX [Roseateles sp. YR242]|uniref:regulatory protein RecX n=1 Tax=Roseateles sp. YR242 TaxID=1855305 RepID=UPI002872BCFC|nr:regulatory protein RecX [Roseateles sp. YR242]
MVTTVASQSAHLAHPPHAPLSASLLEDFDPVTAVDLDDEADTADVSQEVEAVLVWVRAQGYLDESRFVESRLHARASRWGQRRIEQELAQHGLSLDAEQRAALAQSELGRACELLRRKFGAATELDAAAEARQMRFLMGRGFGSELCRRAIRAVRAGEQVQD